MGKFGIGFRGALLAAALALLSPGVAAAQNVGEGGGGTGGSGGGAKLVSTPAEKFAIAPGGVDMRTGQYAYEETDLSIGGLALTRTMQPGVLGNTSPFGNFSHNLDIMITERRINIFEHNYETGPDFRMSVRFAGRSETFDAYGNATGFKQASQGAYSTLSFAGGDKANAATVYTFQASDGTIATFRPIGGGDCSTMIRCAYVARIEEPDGTVLTFDYGPGARLRSVTSSRGYALLLESAGDFIATACLLNLAVTPKPADHLCPDDAQATATYTYTSFAGKTRLATVKDPGGAVAAFTYASSGQTIAMGMIKPGHASPWLTNMVTNGSDMDGGSFEVTEAQTFADGRAYTYSFDLPPPVEGQIPSIAGGMFVDALGHRTEVRFAFPEMPGSRTPPFNTDANGYPWVDLDDIVFQQTSGPARIVDPLGRVTLMDHCDPKTAADLPEWEQHRCLVGPLRSFTDPEGIRTELSYDPWRNISQVRRKAKPEADLPDIVTAARFDCINFKSCAKPNAVTDGNGHVTDYSYSLDHGGVLTETGPAVPTRQTDGSIAQVRPQKRSSYAQRRAWVKTGSGGYAPAGPPVWLLTGESFCRTSAASGNPAAPCARQGDEVVTSYDYGPDAGPNILLLRGTAVTADGETLRSCYAHDDRGNRISETGPGANLAACPAGPPVTALPDTNSFRYDADGRQTGIISPDPDGAAGPLPFPAVRNSYTEAGELQTVEHGELAAWQSEAVAPKDWTGFLRHRRTDFVYDSAGRKIVEAATATGTVRSTTHYKYDRAGRLICTAQRMNPDAFFGEADACIAGPAAAPGSANDFGPDRITRNVYDDAGQLLQVREAAGTADESATTWSYTPNGKRAFVIDGRGNRAELRYDGHDRQSRWVFPAEAAPPATYNDASPATAIDSAGGLNEADYELYGYDAEGNRTVWRKRDGSELSYSYDALDRMAAKFVPERTGLTSAQTRDVFYAYDLRGLQTEADFDSLAGDGVTNGYDGFGRLSSSRIAMAGASRTLAYRHDRDGNRVELAWPDSVRFSFSHDGLERMTHVRQGALGSTVSLATIGYDRKGLRASLARASGDNTSYAYDGMARLASLTDAFASGLGNSISTFTYNPASQVTLLTRSNDAYAWRGHCNVDRPYATTGLNQYDQAGDTGFDYDANGNLTRSGAGAQATHYRYDVENRLVSASGARSANLVWDPLGRLFEVSGGSAGPTQFLYDGDELVAEYDGVTGGLVQRYVHGAGVDDPLIWYEGATLGQPRFLHSDHQGSITAIASGAGQLIRINAYDEYGIPAAGNWGRFAYTGQAWIPELAMYHYKARIYSPTLGRFLQVDPVGYEGGLNLFAYAYSDPVNHSDPTGNLPPEGSGGDRRWLEHGRQIGADIAVSPTKTDDAVLVGAVGAMAAPAVFAGGQAALSVFIQNAPVLTEATAVAAETIAPGAGGVVAVGVGVRPYQSGAANELRAASRPGDGLDIHHGPQGFVAEQVASNYERAKGPAIALPAAEHRAIPRVKGPVIGLSVRGMLARETRNLRNFTQAPRQQIRSWLAQAKRYFGVR